MPNTSRPFQMASAIMCISFVYSESLNLTHRSRFCQGEHSMLPLYRHRVNRLNIAATLLLLTLVCTYNHFIKISIVWCICNVNYARKSEIKSKKCNILCQVTCHFQQECHILHGLGVFFTC